MVIDVFCHFFPARFLAERNRRAGPSFDTQYAKYYRANRGLTDLDVRFRILDKFPDVRQLLTIAGPNIESITKGRDTVELARMANDGLAELVSRHPDRFISAGACLPMNDVDAALREADRAILDLGFRAVEVFTDINGRPLDSPEFFPLYEKMQAYDLPILLHPRRTNTTPDYVDEATSKFLVYTNFGWPFETSKAMARLAFGGVDGAVPAAEDRDASRRRAGAVLPQARRAVVGLQRAADGLPARRPDALAAAARLLSLVLLRHRDSGESRRADVRPRVLRRRSHDVRHRLPVQTTSSASASTARRFAAVRGDGDQRRGADRRSSRTTPAACSSWSEPGRVSAAGPGPARLRSAGPPAEPAPSSARA